MTLIIATTISDGVVLTADSRQSYVNRSGLPRIASDNATKIVGLTSKAVVAASGPAFFFDGGRLRSIQAYLEDFRDSIVNAAPDLTLILAQQLNAFLEQEILRIVKATITQNIANEHGAGLVFQPVANGKLPYSYIDADSQPKISEWSLPLGAFIVAGRDPDNKCHAITIAPFTGVGAQSTTDAPTFQWVGDSTVINSLFAGPDPFVISVATMTVQDAIDFSIVLTRTTENIQKFSDGTTASQGGIPSVGGPIDVVFLPKSGNLTWLNQKKLHAELHQY